MGQFTRSRRHAGDRGVFARASEDYVIVISHKPNNVELRAGYPVARILRCHTAYRTPGARGC